MQTYGRKWRGNSTACAPGHVSWSNAKPFLRLDSTGEVSSVDHTSPGDKTQLPSTARSDSCFKMKNWVTNRFFHVNNHLTSANNLTNSKNRNNLESTQNMFECLTGDFLSDRVATNMNPKTPRQKFQTPQCGVSGWNNGHGFRSVGGKAFGVFPCHQFSNSFNAGYYPFHSQGNMGMFNVCQFDNGILSHVDAFEDRFWHQRQRKQDRCHRGHSPKHQKREHSKTDSKTSLTRSVTSADDTKLGKTQSEDTSKHSNDAMKKHPQQPCVSKSKKVDSQNMDIIEQFQIQVQPVDCVSSILDEANTEEINSAVKTDTREYSMAGDCLRREQLDDTAENVTTELSLPLVRPEVKKTEESLSPEEGLMNSLPPEDVVNSLPPKEGVMNSVALEDVVNSVAPEDVVSSLPPKEDVINSNNEKYPYSAAKDSNIDVLLIRRNRKKGRATSRRQRKRKIAKAKSASCSNEPDPSSCSEGCVDGHEDDLPHKVREDGEDKQSKRCASVSFVLGLTQSPSSPKVPNGASSKFTFSFTGNDSDNDEGWDEDEEDDIDFGHIQGTFSQCDLFNFLPKCNKTEPSPINFQVHISPVQSSCDGDKTLEDINASWNIHISVNEVSSENLKQSKKKVHFPEDKDLTVVHPMIHWSYAYRAARKGHWENYVRDRDRFQRRIQDVETVLVPVLDSKHRQSVYEERLKTEKN